MKCDVKKVFVYPISELKAPAIRRNLEKGKEKNKRSLGKFKCDVIVNFAVDWIEMTREIVGLPSQIDIFHVHTKQYFAILPIIASYATCGDLYITCPMNHAQMKKQLYNFLRTFVFLGTKSNIYARQQEEKIRE